MTRRGVAAHAALRVRQESVSHDRRTVLELVCASPLICVSNFICCPSSHDCVNPRSGFLFKGHSRTGGGIGSPTSCSLVTWVDTLNNLMLLPPERRARAPSMTRFAQPACSTLHSYRASSVPVNTPVIPLEILAKRSDELVLYWLSLL